jgi:hypothetical protein
MAAIDTSPHTQGCLAVCLAAWLPAWLAAWLAGSLARLVAGEGLPPSCCCSMGLKLSAPQTAKEVEAGEFEGLSYVSCAMQVCGGVDSPFSLWNELFFKSMLWFACLFAPSL